MRTSSCSPGHKIFGPTGIGALYGREDALEETPPWQGGGNMIADVTLERSLYQGPPNKFEAGTGNIADAVGLGEALRYVRTRWHRTHRGLRACAAGVRHTAAGRHRRCPARRHRSRRRPACCRSCWRATNRWKSARRSTPRASRCAPGHHCAQPILRRLGLEATVRPSFAFYNTFEEIDVFLNAVRRIAEGEVAV